MIRSWMLASRAACSTSARVAPAFAYAMLSNSVPWNRYGSWVTMPTDWASESKVTSRTSCPSIRMAPRSTS